MKAHKDVIQLLVNESTVLITIVIGTLLQFIANVQFARILQPEVFGNFMLALKILNFLRPLNQLGMLYSITYYVSNYIDNEAYSCLKGFIKWIWRRYLILGLIVVLCSLAIAGMAHYFLIHDGSDLIFYLLWLIPIKVLVSMQKSLLAANSNYAMSTIPSQIISFLTLNIFLLLIAYATEKYPIYWVIVAYLASLFITISIQHIGLLRDLYPKIRNFAPTYSTEEWAAKGNRMFLIGSVFSAINVVDMLMLRILGNDQRELSVLAAIFSILMTVTIITQAIKLVVTPLISRLIKKENYSKLQSVLNIINLYKVIYLIIVTFLLIKYGTNILGFFGDEYMQFYSQFLLALIGALIFALFDFPYFLLTYGNHENITDRIALFQLISLIVMDIFLIPTYQLTGAVLAIVISELLSNCIAIYYVAKKTPVKAFFIV